MPILFDLDGTLLDTAPDFVLALNKLRAKINLPPLLTKDIRATVSDGVSALIHASFGIESSNINHETLSKDFLELYEQEICRFTEPFPGILPLLNQLEKSNILWGIVTNKPGHLTNALLNQLNLKDRAACIVSGDTTQHKKPHPAPLLYASSILDVSPKECIYIGDAERDIQAGRAAGMVTIGALFGYITDIEAAKQWGASYYVHSAEEILPLILDWKKKK